MAWFREWLRGETEPRAETASTTERPTTERPGPAGRPGPSGSTPAAASPTYPGETFGLPETGPGSVATLARRGAQFVLDALLAGLVASLFTYPALPQNWSLLSWALLMVVPVALFGATPAMAMLGMRVTRLDRPEVPAVGPLWALVRTASVFFVVPALLVDRDGRGVQDRASRTVVLRSR